MLRPQTTTLLCSLILALGACKMTVNSSNADEARPDPGAAGNQEDASKPLNPDDAAQEGDDASAGGDAEPGEGADPSATLTSEAAVTCEDGKYKPGDSWKVECNTCRCSDEGQAMCTRMACRETVTSE